jgi:Zn-dependent M32 family carboxypeptidase
MHYRRAYFILEENVRAPPKDVAQFLSHILEIEHKAINLRQKASKVDIACTGYDAYNKMSKLEKIYQENHDNLIDARKSILKNDYEQFNLLEPRGGIGVINWNDFGDDILEQINTAFDELERTRTLITSKQSTATSRLSATVSTGILVISGFTLVISAIN